MPINPSLLRFRRDKTKMLPHYAGPCSIPKMSNHIKAIASLLLKMKTGNTIKTKYDGREITVNLHDFRLARQADKLYLRVLTATSDSIKSLPEVTSAKSTLDRARAADNTDWNNGVVCKGLGFGWREPYARADYAILLGDIACTAFVKAFEDIFPQFTLRKLSYKEEKSLPNCLTGGSLGFSDCFEINIK